MNREFEPDTWEEVTISDAWGDLWELTEFRIIVSGILIAVFGMLGAVLL